MRRPLHNYCVALALALGLLFGSATVALADHKPDYDWWSWEKYRSEAIDKTLGTTYRYTSNGYITEYFGVSCYGCTYAQWYYHGDAGVYYYPPGNDSWIYRNAYTYYDEGEMDSRYAGSYDWYRLYTHERAHQTGWDHHEEPWQANAAWDPYITLCQC